MQAWKRNLEKYAELVVKIGVNLGPGQDLMIESPMECQSLTRLIVDQAYAAGAGYVQVNWVDDAITRSRFVYGHEASIDYYPEWHADMLARFAERGGAVLNIKVPDPDLYHGIDAELVSRASKAAAMARKAYQHYVRTSKFSWCLIKAPTKAWASKVYADLPEEDRVDAMWDAIFRMNRIYDEDPVASWKAHLEQLRLIRKFLNEKRYSALHYRRPGTDLRVELPEGHIWLGGDKDNGSGMRFVANMPTEEVFTIPKRTGVNGTVTSTKPLNVNGAIVDEFSFTFENGKVVRYDAKVGIEHLDHLLAMDEGSRYLGEVALVPHRSPISNMDRIFYNTGIDENASCHLALGSCYPTNLENGTKLSDEELLQRGGNTSLIHVDFMMGASDLDIDGILVDGRSEPLFRQGNWAVSFETQNNT